MTLAIHWAEQALLEVTSTVKADDDRSFSVTVMNLVDLLYELEQEQVKGNETVIHDSRCCIEDCDMEVMERFAIKFLPQKWHDVIREAVRVEESGTSLFESPEQRIEVARECATYIIGLCHQRYNLFP